MVRQQRNVRPDDPPSRWCGSCGHRYNPYRYSTCPPCYVDDGDGFWLGCDECGYAWIDETSPAEAECPRCEADSRAIDQVRTPA